MSPTPRAITNSRPSHLRHIPLRRYTPPSGSTIPTTTIIGVECGWPDCVNAAQVEAVPGLVEVPENARPEDDDLPVYLCADHRALYRRAQQANLLLRGPDGRIVIGPDGPLISSEMEAFISGLNGRRSTGPSATCDP